MQLPTENFRPTRADWAQAGIVVAALFALYAITAPRTVALEDDGLFVLSSYFLGIEHPPGYPLFVLIGHFFSKLPFGSVAYRVHLVSALFGALTGGLLWLCARSLIAGRLPAYFAAFALGFAPVFWSQSVIAEVYTLNTFFLLVLVYLGLRVCPPAGQTPSAAGQGAILSWMAFIFGLSLSNHWPLMLLVAPAFVVLLWPVRYELLRRFGNLSWLVALGLLPYVWLVYRSWGPVPISFYGPLDTLSRVWFFLSRAGYAEVDHPLTADWLDRVAFFRFLGVQLVVQFAVLGTIVAATGFAVQWRNLGHRVAAFLTVAFLMPSAVLLLLLGFDYSSVSKHVFHVYPLPAYAVVALWAGLGLAWLSHRYSLRPALQAVVGGVVLALILAAGIRTNVYTDYGWGARYAQTVLKMLPKNAVVFARGEVDLGTIAYFHLVEQRRPDITLYQTRGLILGNRLFDPLGTTEETMQEILRKVAARETNPVVSTLEAFTNYARRDRWLYVEADKSSDDALKETVDIPEVALRYLEESVLNERDPNAWIAHFQCEFRRRYAQIRARSMDRSRPPDPRIARHLEILSKDYCGAFGMVEGLMQNRNGYSVGAVASLLDRVRDTMPSDALKEEKASYFHLRGAVRANLNDDAGAISDFETSVSLWPGKKNPSIEALEDLYAKAGNESAAKALERRVKRYQRARQ